jgi:uncharacterized surface protein with fasciclin (FAS1) repeats
MRADHIASSSIVDTLVNAGSFSTLLEAVVEADLSETLLGESPFTLFAQTNEAFAKVPADVEEALLHDKRRLREILKYHVREATRTSHWWDVCTIVGQGCSSSATRTARAAACTCSTPTV